MKLDEHFMSQHTNIKLKFLNHMSQHQKYIEPNGLIISILRPHNTTSSEALPHTQ